ncbi:DUF1853 family protein [uncultured Aquimarina sp.]|uniref:DUF1853 family protein n=1 Tax=uncultured Aquimarina sp. TaxID=575652 RepID=UPI002632D9A4|nr:DUF1853 family protein [uncultured Aquimarina sp.]
MSIKKQYAGFLDSKLLWKSVSLFELSQFDLQISDGFIPNEKELPIQISENEVLGKRIEHFFEYFVNSSENYKIILKNLQIFKDKITIGELDFLLEDLQRKQVFHIELIYKFYLYDPKRSEVVLERWIGPNRNDSLLEKVTKLKEKQLPLLYRSETITTLQKLDIRPNDIVQKVCFFGNLFVPLSHENKKISHLNNECIVGYWIHAEEFTEEKYGSYRYYIPKKKDWITDPTHNETWHTFASISDDLNTELTKKKSSLLWIKSNEDNFSKCFIVWW